jgi:hypothetical protein
MSCVNHSSTRELVARFLGSEETRSGGVYMMLDEENRGCKFW